jgi:hypothetical protein
MLYYQTVSPNLLTVLKDLMQLPELSVFRLVGGTALSLQIGHRKSIDIDLFTDVDFDIRELQILLKEKFASFEIRWQNKHGFVCSINEVKVDFLNWHTTFVTPLIIKDGIALAGKEEIAAMKFEAITSRKEKKDFIDIAFLLQQFLLEDLLGLFKVRYPFINTQMVLESLMAVDFADKTEEPVMIIKHKWDDTKQLIINSVNEYLIAKKNDVYKAQQQRIKNAEALLQQKKNNT